MKRPAIRFVPWIQTGTVFLLSFLLMGIHQVKGGELVLQEAVSYRAEGRRYQQVGDLHSAANAYQKAIVANPSYSDAYNDLGIVLESLGNFSEAEKAYKTALRLNPRLVSVHSNLALLYEKMSRMDEAAAHWTARVNLGPPDDPWVNKARQKLESYHFPVPESSVEAARKRKPELKAQEQEKRRAKVYRQQAAPPAKEVKEAPELADAKTLALALAKEKAGAAKQKTGRDRRQREQAEAVRKKELAAQKLQKQVKDQASKEEARAAKLKAEEERRQTEKAEAVRKKELAAQKSQKKAVAQKALPPAKPQEISSGNQALLAQADRIAKALAKEKTKSLPSPESQRLAEKFTKEKEGSQRRSVGELIQRGISAMRQGRYAEAVVHYQQALVLDPKSTEADQGLKRAQAALAKSK